MLTDAQRKEFDQNGFLVIPKVLNRTQVQKGRKAYLQLRSNCVRSKHPHTLTFGYNLFNVILGIEQPFLSSVHVPELFKLIQESEVLEYSKAILKEDDLALGLIRLICTYKVSFDGRWHRDGQPSVFDYIQTSILLYPEAGFKVVPGSHNRSDDEVGCANLKQASTVPLENEVEIGAEAGDLVLFHPSILHRGTCVGRGKYQRAHVHMRLMRSSFVKEFPIAYLEGSLRDEVLKDSSSDWKTLLKRTDELASFNRAPEVLVQPTLKTKLIRKLLEFNYFLSKFTDKDLILPYNNKECIYLTPKKKWEYLYREPV